MIIIYTKDLIIVSFNNTGRMRIKNLITFNKFLGSPDGLGQIFALFVIAIAAASAVVGLVLVIAVYRNMKTIFTEKMNILKW